MIGHLTYKGCGKFTIAHRRDDIRSYEKKRYIYTLLYYTQYTLYYIPNIALLLLYTTHYTTLYIAYSLPYYTYYIYCMVVYTVSA